MDDGTHTAPRVPSAPRSSSSGARGGPVVRDPSPVSPGTGTRHQDVPPRLVGETKITPGVTKSLSAVPFNDYYRDFILYDVDNTHRLVLIDECGDCRFYRIEFYEEPNEM